MTTPCDQIDGHPNRRGNVRSQRPARRGARAAAASRWALCRRPAPGDAEIAGAGRSSASRRRGGRRRPRPGIPGRCRRRGSRLRVFVSTGRLGGSARSKMPGCERLPDRPGTHILDLGSGQVGMGGPGVPAPRPPRPAAAIPDRASPPCARRAGSVDKRVHPLLGRVQPRLRLLEKRVHRLVALHLPLVAQLARPRDRQFSQPVGHLRGLVGILQSDGDVVDDVRVVGGRRRDSRSCGSRRRSAERRRVGRSSRTTADVTPGPKTIAPNADPVQLRAGRHFERRHEDLGRRLVHRGLGS
ncbi:MAG: hypothetical protein MZV64_44215 [Ignavibacteriales bacterium]|nr:hypothetical protein [Ignavibacteriales bacterium]